MRLLAITRPRHYQRDGHRYPAAGAIPSCSPRRGEGSGSRRDFPCAVHRDSASIGSLTTGPTPLPNRYHFDEHYREDAELRDGTSVQLRLVRPADRELLRGGFHGLSGRSRYLRFMGAKANLTEAELEALTTLDGMDHLAIGALRWDPASGAAEGLAVARFVRLPQEPDVAEAAVTVVDAVQRQGLGSLLLRRLAAAARERGIRWFRGDVLACNEPMRRLLADHVATTVEPDEDVLRVLVELTSFRSLMAAPADEGDLLGRLLAHAAGGRIVVRTGDLLLKRS